MKKPKRKSAKKKPTKKRPCNCIDIVNKGLESHGASLETNIEINFKTQQITTAGPIIALHKSSKAKPLATMYCTYCPFCGKKMN